jgi:hypothetical protein
MVVQWEQIHTVCSFILPFLSFPFLSFPFLYPFPFLFLFPFLFPFLSFFPFLFPFLFSSLHVILTIIRARNVLGKKMIGKEEEEKKEGRNDVFSQIHRWHSETTKSLNASQANTENYGVVKTTTGFKNTTNSMMGTNLATCVRGANSRL